MARCDEPEDFGDPFRKTFIHARKGDPNWASFQVELSGIYLCQEPSWKQSDDDEVLAEDDQIAVRRFYIWVRLDGSVTEITDSVATDILGWREELRSRKPALSKTPQKVLSSSLQ